MKISGAIFDLDGTLLDSMFIWDSIGSEYLLSRGITPGENLNETFRAMSLKQAADYMIAQYGLTDSPEAIMDGINRMVEGYYYDTVLPKPGVRAFLERLRERNVPMCVATATDRHLVEAALTRVGLLNYFSEIFTCTNVGSGKDEPAIFEAALAHLGTPRAETAVFEDALYAITTAKKAGFIVVGIYDKWEAANSGTIKNRADVCIRSFDEMGDWLD